MKTINVVGCGSVGSTLGRLWTDRKVLKVQSILNRSLDSSARAVEFVGSGHAVRSYVQLGRADLVMISTSDDVIESCCRQLCATDVVGEGVIVFHVSGSLPSALLEPARARGASIASVHPVKSFADPGSALKTFAGTYCAVEGDRQACKALAGIFERSGAIPFQLNPDTKAIYHAGTVVVCNYLVALIEVGLRCFEEAGVPRELAMKVIPPIVRGTVDNIFKLGPVHALTGPIARGEPSVIENHIRALGTWDDGLQRLYASLGRVAIDLSRAQGMASSEALADVEALLDG